MKFIVWKVIFIFMILSFVGCKSSEEGPLRTLKITYKTTTDISSTFRKDTTEGEVIRFIDMENNRLREEDWRKIYNSKKGRIVIFDGDWIYEFDADENEAVYSEYEDTTRPIWEYQKVYDQIVQEDNFAGEEKVAGEKCEIYEIETRNGHRTIWIWDNIVLKDTVYGEGTGVSGSQTWEAVKIEKNVNLENDLFILPSGHTAISKEEYYERLQEKAEDMLQRFQ
jgi:hypothetical protein